jgi:iron complex outermembrane receptor protein
LALIGIAFGARAQERPHALEEVVVTATRVETSLQQTPMAIHALSAGDLELEGIDAGRDLGIMVPNVVLNPGTGGEREPIMKIRGLPGVTTYVDGIWLGSWGFLQRNFVELERVEVLLGPQGTLFGRNTNGGAIQLVTRRPADQFGAKLDVAAGEFERRALTLAVDWPIAATLKTRWTVASDRNEGFLEGRAVPLTLGEEDSALLRADIIWQPSEAFSLRFNANDESSHGSDARIVRISNPDDPAYIAYNALAGNPDYLGQARAIDPQFPAPPAPLAGDRYTPETHEAGYPGGTLGKWQTRSDTTGPTSVYDNRYVTLTIDWQITPRIALQSLTSAGEAESRQISDYDASEFTLRTRALMDRTTATTQELHLTGSHFDGRLESLLGVYYQEFRDQRRTYRWVQWEFAIPNTGPNPGTPGLPGVGGRPDWNRDALQYVRAWGATVGNAAVAGYIPLTFETADFLEEQVDVDRALFGQFTIALPAKLDLTLGFRVTGDDGRFTQYVPAEAFRPTQPGAVASGDLFAAAAVIARVEEPDFGTATTPRVSLGARPTEAVYVYASYAEGFTSSAVVNNPLGGPAIVLDPEVVETRELGLRSDWLQGRLRLNATYFDSTWDGFRVPKQIDDPITGFPLARVSTSDGVAKSEGLEVEAHYLPAERWQIDLAAAILDTEYVDVGDPPANGSGLQPGIPFQYAPESSYSLAVRYRLPLAVGEVSFASSYGWMNDYERVAANDIQSRNSDGSRRPEPAYGIWNARIDYRPSNRNWRLSLFGTNLTDEWYVNGGIDIGLYEGYDFGTIGRPREVGLGAQIVFD